MAIDALLPLAGLTPGRVLLPAECATQAGAITGGFLLGLGAIMGWGAARVPGGNDLLLWWAIPGLTLYGALAYASMLLVIASGLQLGRRRGQPGASV